MGSLERFPKLTFWEMKEDSEGEWSKLEAWSSKGRRGKGGRKKRKDQ